MERTARISKWRTMKAELIGLLQKMPKEIVILYKTDESCMSRQHDKISGPEVGGETVTDAGSFSFFSEGKQIKVNKHADIRQ